MTSRLLVDTNLLVLLAVGTVNRRRIEVFKRTRQYTIRDFDPLLRVLGNWNSLYTVPQVMAEVSNLTDLAGPERQQVRHFLKNVVFEVTEVNVSQRSSRRRAELLDFGLSGCGNRIGRAGACVRRTDA